MTDSEKILAILERMDTRLANVEQDVSGLKQDVSSLKQGQAKLEQGQAKLEQGQAELREIQDNHLLILTRMEITHGQKLDALFDGHYVNKDMLKRIESDAAETRSDVADLHLRLVSQKITLDELRKAN